MSNQHGNSSLVISSPRSSISSQQELNQYNEIDETNLVKSLDKRLLFFAMFSNLVKTMDNVNISTAFISGMEADLNIVGNQYNIIIICFLVGYLIMQIPSNILLSHYRPSRYLPILESIWCILTLSMACVQSVQAVFILRFFLGLAEAGCFPAIMFLLGNWYTKKELGKRTSIVAMCGTLGGALSGLIQAVFLKTIDGFLGISGWRWLFLFDGVLTALVGIFGYFYLPDDIHNTKWLTEKERGLALKRINLEGRDSTTAKGYQKWNIKPTLKKIFRNPYVYLLVLAWTLLTLALGSTHVLGIMSKRLGYDATMSNLFTTPDMLTAMLVVICNGFISDYYRNRFWAIVVPSVFGIIGCSMLVGFVQPFGFLYFAYILTHAGLAASQPVVMAWANELLLSDREVRAITIAAMNTTSTLMYSWCSILLWPVTDAPYYKC
ncbi:major facilitator superfamily domain-containing protein [Cunninghamella echinulata]|nr:major facilitator superfamily domain-containing protein [Cunninghamella echinulata]